MKLCVTFITTDIKSGSPTGSATDCDEDDDDDDDAATTVEELLLEISSH